MKVVFYSGEKFVEVRLRDVLLAAEVVGDEERHVIEDARRCPDANLFRSNVKLERAQQMAEHNVELFAPIDAEWRVARELAEQLNEDGLAVCWRLRLAVPMPSLQWRFIYL